MKISALRLHNVKRFAGRGVAIEDIGDGVNVLSAANEYGKSTSFEALHALFFLPYSSKSKDVAALRPYSGGSPMIEADVETAEGRYRVTKQFFGGASAQVIDQSNGRLIAQADEAENFLADLVRGGAGGPAGMLWVRQGNTGLEKRSRADEDGERQVRESLLQSVQGEVEAVTGGRRMAEIMAAVSDDYLALVTPTGRPKAGGRYAAAIAERDRLAEKKARLSDEVTALRHALDERAKVQSRLTELSNADDAQEREQKLKAAEEALTAARAQDEQLKTAQARLDLVREQHENAARKQTNFWDAQKQLRTLEDELGSLNKKRDDARDRRAQAVQAMDLAQAAVETAEAAETTARALLDSIEATSKAREAAQHLAALREKLAKAEITRQAIDENEALFKQLDIGARPIEELAALEVQVAQLLALRKAARPSVQVAYEDGTATRVIMDGEPLIDGEDRDYGSHTQLIAAGIGTISLRSNWEDDDSRVEKLEKQRLTLLSSMGVADLGAARAQQAKALDHKAWVREGEIKLDALVPEGLPKLRDAIAQYSLIAVDNGEAEGPVDPAEARRAQDEAIQQRKQASDKLRELAPARAGAEDDLRGAETQIAEVGVKIEHLVAVLGPQDGRDERSAALKGALEPLIKGLEDAQANVNDLLDRAVDVEAAHASFNRIQSIQKGIETATIQAQVTLAELNAQIRTRAEEAVEENWRETLEALTGANSRVETFEKEVATLQRLTTTLEDARSQARDLYLKPVMTELKPLLGLLFDDVAISFDEKTLLPEKLVRNGLEEDIDRLSGGMREQLSVLTRLAFARLLAQDGRPAPVILDDALVYSDDDRIEKMFDALHRQSQGQQIIVFSCRQRAFQKLGGNVLQMTDWHQ